MENKESLEDITTAALLSLSPDILQRKICDVLPHFSSPLKTNFEDINLWQRFGLVLALKQDSPRSALQAFNECLRIDQNDPLPAMLAAKLLLYELDDPDAGLRYINDAIERCQRIQTANVTALSKSYLLAGIMHAYIFEREPESIKRLKEPNLKASEKYLSLAESTYSQDYLIYFHKALHKARQRDYSSAIDNISQSIQLNPHHLPSLQLLMISLSAKQLDDEALLLCESALHEFEDNLMLLYIKCNLEQRLVKTKGYKSALNTVQYMLKCIRKKSITTPSHQGSFKIATTVTAVQATAASNATSTTTATANGIGTTVVTGIGGGESIRVSLADQTPLESKQSINLFAEDCTTNNKFKQDPFISGELSVWLLVAEIFIRIGSVGDAEQCVDEASNYVNGALSYQLMFIRGLIAKSKNCLLEAKSFLQSCLALCPRHARALQQMAHVYYLLRNFSAAEKFLKDSLDVDSDCDETWHYLGSVYIETKQHDKAKECNEKASELEKERPVIPISVISRLTRESQ